MLGSYITPNMFAGYLKTAFLAGRVEGVFNPYASQSGLQGTIFGVMNLLFEKASLNTYLRWTIFRAANAAFFVAMMLFLSLWIWRRIGVLGAVAAFSCTIFSTYSTMTMPNLYWVTWTMLLPMVLSAAACDWLKKCGRRPAVWVTLVGISVLGRCMCGFEFVSVVMVATELPVVLEWLMAESKDRRAWFRLAVWMGIAQLAAFALAVVIWILQVYWMSGDWQMVRDAVLHTIAKRTGLFPKWAGENAAELESLKVSKLKVLLMYLPQKIFLDQFTILQIITIAAASFIPPALLGWKRSERRLELMRQAKFTGVALFSLAAPLSWHILASGHSWIHTHVNVFLWLIPAVPLLLAAAGGNLQLLAKIIRDRI